MLRLLPTAETTSCQPQPQRLYPKSSRGADNGTFEFSISLASKRCIGHVGDLPDKPSLCIINAFLIGNYAQVSQELIIVRVLRDKGFPHSR